MTTSPTRDKTLKFLVNSIVTYSKCLQEAFEKDDIEQILYFKGKLLYITERLTIRMKEHGL